MNITIFQAGRFYWGFESFQFLWISQIRVGKDLKKQQYAQLC